MSIGLVSWLLRFTMSDHILREVVNDLTKVAKDFHDAQQLRARIREAVEPLLKDHERIVAELKKENARLQGLLITETKW
jgi:uncharacterized membrane protein